MIAVLLAGLGLAALVAAAVVLRRSPGYRVGRLLAGAPAVSIERALEIASSDQPRFVRVHGRISSDEEFPDEQDRPLVYRRKRIELRDEAGSWRPAANETEAVPFGVGSRDSYIGVDATQLSEGLVVIPRTADGVVADLPRDLRETAARADAPARLVIEQLSAVEHAWVAGVPKLDARGQPTVSSGLGRPLVVTTLELDDAMRLLGAGNRRALFATLALVVVALALLGGALFALLAGAGAALAQSPSPAPVPTPFDPRGGGNGPGTVGAPFLAAVAVIGLGIVAAAATAVYVRLATRR